MRRLVAAVLSGILLASSTDAAALVLCERKRRVTAREACRSNEQQLSPVGLGTPGGAGADGPAGPEGPEPLRLLDAMGADVGPVVNLHFNLPYVNDPDFPLIQAVLVRAPLPEPVLIGAGLAGIPVGTVYYQSQDCTGTPLVGEFSLLPTAEVIGQSVFLATGQTVVVTTGSQEGGDASGGCVSVTPRSGCCKPIAVTISLSIASQVTTLDALGIVPPLRAVTK
jgi:hypothetical protein